MPRDDVGDPGVNDVERLFPGDSGEAPLALGADALQRMAQSIRTMNEFGVKIRDLGANGPMGDGIDLRAPDRDHLVAGHRYAQAAGVGAIERANTGTFHIHEGSLRYATMP